MYSLTDIRDIDIICFVGGLGSGKTLCLTWLALMNYKLGIPIFSNYHLNKIDYTYIEPELQEKETKKASADKLIEMIDNMRNGFFAGDELWSMMDSRMSFTKQNRFCAKILLKSRKRKLRIGYTAQDFMQTEKRLRRITSYIGYPSYDKYRHLCLLEITDKYGNPVKQFRIKAKLIYPFYSTEEEVDYTEAY